MSEVKKKTGKRHMFGQSANLLRDKVNLDPEPSSDRFDLATIRVDEVRPDPDNPRHFGYRPPTLEECKLGAEHVRQTTEDPRLGAHLAEHIEAVLSLAQSLKKNKQVQPIAVYKDRGEYRIIGGETRWLAHLVNGATSIDAKVFLEKPKDLRARQYAENAHRSNVSLLGETEAIRRIFDIPVKEFHKITMAQLMEVAAMPRRKAKRWAAILRHADVVSAIYERTVHLRSTAERLGAIQDDADRAAALAKIREDGDTFSLTAEPSLLEPATASRKEKRQEKPRRGPKKTQVNLGRISPSVAAFLLEQLADFAEIDLTEDPTPEELEGQWKALLKKAEIEAKKGH